MINRLRFGNLLLIVFSCNFIAKANTKTINRTNFIDQIVNSAIEKSNHQLEPLNVKTFGAKGDGANDDQKAINQAISASINSGRDLFFPTGTYLLNSFPSSDSNVLLDFPKGKRSNRSNLRIFGEKNTKLTTNLSNNKNLPGARIMRLNGLYLNYTIEGITFENTHGLTINQTNAISTAGTSQNLVKGLIIKDCKFEGFSTAISLTGCDKPVIDRCEFSAPLGRDNAQMNTHPAVFVWFINNPNGLVIHPLVQNCTVNGFTGKDINFTKSKCPMDGFIYGSSIGGTFRNNVVRNCGVEHIFITKYKAYAGKDNNLVLITGNKFYLSSIPGGLRKYTYGIRSESYNLKIENNYFYDCAIGILLYNYKGIKFSYSNWKIFNNKFYVSTQQFVKKNNCINIQGYGTKGNNLDFPVLNTQINGNELFMSNVKLTQDYEFIKIAFANKTQVSNNKIIIENVDKSGFSLKYCNLISALNTVFRNNIINDKSLHLDTIYKIAPSKPASTYLKIN